MKGLIRKDFISIWAYCRNYFLVCGIFLAASVFAPEYGFLRMYPLILMGLLPTTLVAYDERDKWDRLCLTMPLSRRQIVIARYLSGGILQSGVFLVSAMGFAVQSVMFQRGIVLEEFLMDLAVLMLLGLAAPTLMLPFVYKLGSERGRMSTLVASAILGVILYLSAGTVGSGDVMKLMQNVSLTAAALAIMAACLMLYGLSCALAIHWYEKREF